MMIQHVENAADIFPCNWLIDQLPRYVVGAGLICLYAINSRLQAIPCFSLHIFSVSKNIRLTNLNSNAKSIAILMHAHVYIYICFFLHAVIPSLLPISLHESLSHQYTTHSSRIRLMFLFELVVFVVAVAIYNISLPLDVQSKSHLISILRK